MANSERSTGTRDAHFDVISVLYHALEGASTAEQYQRDAEQAGDQELAGFFREAQDAYRKLGDRGKQLLKQKLG